MAPLSDPVLLAAYKNALANYRYEGYVRWSEVAQNWVRKELGGYTVRAIAQRMCEYVSYGGGIDQVQENRPEWCHYRYHFDLRFKLGDRRLYVETRLEFRDPSDPDDPVILVANVHDA
jgi:hypothetical protein